MTELKKEITLYGLTMVAIGSCIGSGIFRTPGLVAADLPSPFFILLIWALGGFIALTGALTFAEMGSMFPQAGGIYVYLKEAYGDLIGFLYGWAYLTVITSGAIAALCVVFAEYLDKIIPLGSVGLKIVPVAAIIIVSIVNILRVKAAEIFSNIFTGLKLLGITAIIIVGLFWGAIDIDWFEEYDSNRTENISSPVAQNDPNPIIANESAAPPGLIEALGLALIGVLWSYGGWQHAAFVAGETKKPQSMVPKAMIYGALVVTIVYFLTNVAYLKLLPHDEFVSSDAIATDAIIKIIPSGGKIIALVVAISVFGTAGIYTLSAPRLYYAMARDGLFFQKLAEVHPRFRTPVNAILVQSIWSIILLLLWGTFKDLIDFVVFIDWIFFALGAFAVILFRYTRKDMARPYKTFGYPIVPVVFILITSLFVVSTLIGEPIQAGAGLILVGLALPVFYYFRSKRKKT